MLPPSFSHEVKKGVNIREGETSSALLIGHRRQKAFCIFRVVTGKLKLRWQVQSEKAMMLNEIFRCDMLASTD